MYKNRICIGVISSFPTEIFKTLGGILKKNLYSKEDTEIFNGVYVTAEACNLLFHRITRYFIK